MIVLNILVVFVEVFYFYIILKHIKNIDDKIEKIKLYLGIFLSNIIITVIFGSSIFRYLLYPLLVFILLKILNNKTTFYDFFLFVFLMLIKTTTEYITFLLFFKYLSYFYFVILMEFLSIFSIILIKNKIKKIYYKIIDMWNNNFKFYFRYILLILFNLLIIFLIYNLIIIKEVL